MLVRFIRAPEGGFLRLVFTNEEYIDLSEKEGRAVEMALINELLVCAE
jgi:hypothetical protein